MKKELDDIKNTLQAEVVKLDKEYGLRFEMIKYIDDKRSVVDTIKRSADDVNKIIKGL